MIERRTHPRYEMELPVTLRARGKLIPAACIDISEGGACLLTDFTEEVEEGVVEVVIDLSPRYRDVSLRGRILRFNKGVGQRVAVHFTSPDSQGMQTLRSFLTRQVN